MGEVQGLWRLQILFIWEGSNAQNFWTLISVYKW
jgi:hypothetical protein